MDALDFLKEINESLSGVIDVVDSSPPDTDSRTALRRRPEPRPEKSLDLVGPGTYTVSVGAVSKRVSAATFGAAKRFSDQKEKTEVGPGKYDPNASFVGKKKASVRIVQPTAKSVAVNLKHFEREQEIQQMGPGKYSPSFFSTSETSKPRVAVISKTSKPTLRLAAKRFEDITHSANLCPGSYDPDYNCARKRAPSAPQWSEALVPVRRDAPDEGLPGPGTYDVNINAVKHRIVADVRISKEFNANSARASQAFTIRDNEDFPGPGSYEFDDSMIHLRPPSTRIMPSTTLNAKRNEYNEGDVLLLDPNSDYSSTKRSIRCSAVMKEASFVSQASTRRGQDENLDIGQTESLKIDDHVLSTVRRSRSFSFSNQTGRDSRDLSPTSTEARVGPSSYDLRHTLTLPSTPVTQVLRSSTPRCNPWFPDPNDESTREGNRLILNVERAENLLRTQKAVPDMSKQTDRPELHEVVSDFTGEKDYDVNLDAVKAHVPSVDLSKLAGREAGARSVDDAEEVPGPGSYDVDLTLVRPRVPAAFMCMSEENDAERSDEVAEGDVLDLNLESADKMLRKSVRGVIPMSVQPGRVEVKPDIVPEALEYETDVDAVRPHMPGFKMELLTGRGEDEDEDKVFGKYNPKYSLIERSVPGVDFGMMVGRDEGDDEAGTRREGDILLLHPERGDAFLKVQKPVPDMSKQTDRPELHEVVSDFTGEEDYDVNLDAVKAHVPSVDLSKLAGREAGARSVDDAEEVPGPGSYDVDLTLVRPRVPAAFMCMSEENDAEHSDEVAEGDVLDLNLEIADKMLRKSVRGVIPMSVQPGRVEVKPDIVPEALEYETDVDAVRPHMPGFKMELLTGRGEDEDEDKVFGKYNPKYSLIERSVPGVDFGMMVGRDEGDDEAGTRREGDILLLHPERGDAFLKVQKPVPDMSKQTDRPELHEVVSDFTGEKDYDVNLDAVKAHVPSVDLSKLAGREAGARSVDDAEEVPGPGSYDVDLTLVRPRVPAAFMCMSEENDAERSDEVAEGDVLDLNLESADKMLRKSVRGVIPMSVQPGRVEVKPDIVPEALEYETDVDAVRPHMPGFKMELLTGRGEDEDEDEDRVFGKYNPKYSLIERSVPGLVVFDKMLGRDDSKKGLDNSDEEDSRREGDILLLHPERGDEFLRVQKAVPDMSKQIDRPELYGVSSNFTGEEDYDVDITVLDAHTPVVDFRKMYGRPEPKPDDTIGPGVYDPSDEAIAPHAPAAFFGTEGLNEKVTDERGEGDTLVLHPEVADELVRPVAPRVTMQMPALESEWANSKPMIGDGKVLSSLRERVEAKRASEEKAARARPDFYDASEDIVRRRVYTEASVDMGRQEGRPRSQAKLGLRLIFKTGGAGTRFPRVRSMVKGELAEATGLLKLGDELVMVTDKGGQCTDLRRWASQRRNVPTSKCQGNTKRIVSRLGPWRECATTASGENGHTFYYNVETKVKTWTFDEWKNEERAIALVEELINTSKLPMTLHIRRRPAVALIAVTIQDDKDATFAAYNPNFELVEPAPKGVKDFTTIVGREPSADQRFKLGLFALNLYHHVRENTASEMTYQARCDSQSLRERQEVELRKLQILQNEETDIELKTIEDIVAEATARGDEDVEDLRMRLIAETKERHDREWRKVMDEQRIDREREEAEMCMQVDKAEIKKEVNKIVHKQRLTSDAAERLKETEIQRRRRLGRQKIDGKANDVHTSEYSHGMPNTPARWVDKRKTMTQKDSLNLSDADVDDWKRSTKYKGLQRDDKVVKWFWQLVEAWNAQKRALVLQFGTGTASAPKGGFACLMGHDIRNPDGFVPFTMCRMTPKLLEQATKNRRKDQPLLPKSFIPLNRIYLPEYRCKFDLASALQDAITRMQRPAEEKNAGPAEGEGSTLMSEIECRKKGPVGRIFTILEEEEGGDEA